MKEVFQVSILLKYGTETKMCIEIPNYTKTTLALQLSHVYQPHDCCSS